MAQRRALLNQLLWIFALLILFAVVTTAGWNVFYGYVLPESQSLGGLSNLALFGFAFVAGLGSFFAPCAIAVFPAYVSYYLSLGDDSNTTADHKTRIGKAATLGLVASLGIFTFYLVIGVIIGVFGLTIASYASYLKTGVILILLILGVVLLSGRSINPRALDSFRGAISQKATAGTGVFNIYLYGIVYGSAAATCFLPLFLALVLIPILKGAFFISVFAFLSYASAISLLLILFTTLAALGRNILIKEVASYTQVIKRAAGGVLVLTSLYLMTLFVLYGM